MDDAAPAPAAPAAPSTATATATPPTDHYLMDLGDGMMMKVPIPTTKRKSLGTPTSTATRPHLLHEIKSERLPLGDIILHDPGQGRGQGRDIVLFERKTLNDLAASIQDGRYKEQSFRLIETATATGFHTHNIVYIIEGDLTQYEAKRNKNNRITKTALLSAMVSLMYYKGFSVVRTMNVGETADFILHFADKVAKESANGESTPAYTHAHAPPTHHNVTETHDTAAAAAAAATAQAYSEVATKKEKRDYITRENIGEIMLSQVPGVSPKVASAILAKYGGSIYEFLGDLHRKINDYEESLSPEMSPGIELEIAPTVTTDATPAQDTQTQAPMNKNKLKHVTECFKDVTMDGKRGIGKATIEKLSYFLS
jgi:ERCC4-type nuclease